MRSLPPVQKKRKEGERPQPAGAIRADEALDKNEFLKRTGLGSGAYTTAKRNGLKVCEVGNRVYILGKHWIEFLERKATQ